MKKLLSMVLILTLLMSSITAFAAVTKPAAIPETGVVFYEDFSGYDAANPNAALTANWGYQTSASIATENDNYYASSLNGYVFGDTLFNTKTPISSGKLKISVDVRIPSTYAVGDGTYAVTYAGEWGDVFDPWNVVRTETGAAIYWANTAWVNSTPKPNSKLENPDDDNDIITSEIDCDKWYNLAVVIDYSEGTRTYYLNDNSVGTSAYTGNINFLSLGLAKSGSTGYSAELDNVKIERLSTAVTFPEIGVAFEDDFEGYGVDTGYITVKADDKFSKKWNCNNAGAYVYNPDGKNAFVYWSDIKYQVPSGASATTGIMEYTFDLQMLGSVPNNDDFYVEMTNADDNKFFPFTARKNGDNVDLYFGTGDDYTARPATTVTSTIGTGAWKKIKIRVDYDNRTIDYYVNNKLTASHSGNSTKTAPTERMALNNTVEFKQTQKQNIYIDNVKFERVAPLDPETLNSYTVRNYVPETGLIMKDNFSDYNELADLTGMYYSKPLSSLETDGTNKFLRTNATPTYDKDGNKKDADTYFAYLLQNHVSGAEINTGRLSMTYKVRVNKSTNEQAAKATNALYLMSWSNAGWAGDNSSRNYYNAVMYDNNKPYILWSTYANDSGITSLDEDGNNKMEIEFDTWNTVNVVVDYDNKIVEQFVNGDLKKSISVNDDTIKKFGIGAMTIGRKSAKNNDDDEFNIDVDDLRIERLTAVVPDTVIKKDGTAITSNDVANLAGTALTVEFTVAEAGSANVLIAAYKGEELIGTVTTQSPVAKGANGVELTTGANFAGAETVKAFVFDNFDNITPLAGAASYGK